MNMNFFIFLKNIYLFLDRGEGREKEEGEKHQCVVTSHVALTGEPGRQPRHMPWVGIEPVTLWFSGLHSIHWATLARALLEYSKGLSFSFEGVKKATL